MTMKEFQKIQKEKEKAAERIIAKMEIRETNNIIAIGNINGYCDYKEYGCYLIASLRIFPERTLFSNQIISEYNREDLKQFVLFLLSRHKEEKIKLILWREKKND